MPGHRNRRYNRLLIAVGMLSLLASLLVTVPQSRTARLRAQSAGGNDLLTQLAQRLLSTSPQIAPPPAGVPFYQQSSSPVQLLAGALPADLPLKLPMPPNSTLIGSAARPSYPRPTPVIIGNAGFPAPTPTPAPSGTHVDIVLDAPGTAAEITNFYADAMAKLGWLAPAPYSYAFGPSSGGFLPSSTQGNISSFCQSTDGPWLTVTVLPATSGPQDVRIALDTGNPGPCSSPYPGPIAPPVPVTPPGFSLLPRLQAPPGVSVQIVGGSSGGPGRWTSEALAATQMSAGDLEALYEQELIAAGWARVDGGSAASLAWSTWTIPEQSDWQGFLYVRSGPGDGRRSLHAEVASSNAQTVSGPYYPASFVGATVSAAPAGAGIAATPSPSPTPTPTPPTRSP